VRKCGLVINPSLPWLGASPDGLVKDITEQSFGLLEIKCPYIYRLSTFEDACSDLNFFATIKNDVVTLKETHKHYNQIQGQMALLKISWCCDFVIYHIITLQWNVLCSMKTAGMTWNLSYQNCVLPKAIAGAYSVAGITPARISKSL